ncbi:MAG TPA: HAD-IA family hydrolase [Actinomycetota bacterium]|nr:HAD-IA family hydrolase [Actinomycetota bacterium]
MAERRVLLFDMDGVLIESLEAYRYAYTCWAKIYRIERSQFPRDLHGRRPEDVIASIMVDAPPARVVEALESFERLMEEGTSKAVAMPGAQALVAALPPDRWAVVTSARRRYGPALLAAAGVEPPAVMVCGDDTTQGKPDPECFLKAARALGAAPAACTVVEDAPVGIQAALRGGMSVVAVATTHKPEALSGAPRVYDSLAAASADLLELVR